MTSACTVQTVVAAAAAAETVVAAAAVAAAAPVAVKTHRTITTRPQFPLLIPVIQRIVMLHMFAFAPPHRASNSKINRPTRALV